MKAINLGFYKFAGFPVLVLLMGGMFVADQLGVRDAMSPTAWVVAMAACGVLGGLIDSICYNRAKAKGA